MVVRISLWPSQFLDCPDVITDAQAAQRTVMEAKIIRGNYLDVIRDFPVISFFHKYEPESDV